MGEEAPILAIVILGLFIIAGYFAFTHLYPPMDGPVLCDTYKEQVTINDPDPPGMDYYNGYLAIVVRPPCDVFDVTVSWDYTPSRPMSQPMSSNNLWFEVYFDGQLIYNGTDTIVDFPDSQWNGKTVLVEVRAYTRG